MSAEIKHIDPVPIFSRRLEGMITEAVEEHGADVARLIGVLESHKLALALSLMDWKDDE